ncbi:PAS domain S-box protein [Rhizobium sp. TH2]|uniref:PAS domain S-box protein n=1 Tax=Rhizobium sp. TH2 TaxID=2775403 RepID=UPI002156FEB1|nr:PAS domain S-box protein [Rhizobium sp. TH2]UVC07612.1 PAS domain S-box protein [Rhizobium sp. TH2]
MPQVQYPFIDVAVHPAVRARFAAGEAIALFSRDMKDVLWANGEGARLFGHRAIYDLIDSGPDRGGVAYRQLTATAAQLVTVGDKRGFVMRIASGFSTSAMQAEVNLVAIGGEPLVMFSSPVSGGTAQHLKGMLQGFDDPDTHMAVLDRDGEVLQASPGFSSIGIMQDTARALIVAASRSADGLIKRPVPSGSGYLPAAIGKLSDNLYLLFCVETSLGRMDAPDDEVEDDSALPDASELRNETPAFVAAAAQLDDGVPAQAETDVTLSEVVDSGDTDIGENDLPSVAAEDVIEPVADEVHAAALLDAEQALDIPSENTANEVDEGEAPEDIADLAAIDGADEDQIEAASVMETVTDPRILEHAADTEQAFSETVDAGTIEDAVADAEIDVAADTSAEVFAEENEDTDKEIVSPEFAEASDEATEAPEDFVETHTSESEAVEEAPVAETLVEGSSEPLPTNAAFAFDPGSRPVRFVWKLDAHGSFAEVSDEFARTVGPRSGDINGQSFRDLAALFDLDSDNEIAGLLDRRDTWSGRTIKWPVEGTDLVVPVDLAALPTYSRNREFDGFRGFGIIRVSDAEQDPHAFGLTFATDDSEEDDVPLTVDGTFEQSAGDQPTADEPLPPSQDEFQGEVPALNIVSNPLGNFSDKVIQLEERRAKSIRDGLSASEQAALKEIARQLEPFGKRPNDDVVKSTSGLLQGGDDDRTDRDDRAPADDVVDAEGAGAQDIGADGREHDEQAEDPLMDEERVQTMFEDLGTGPGLTAYAIDLVPMAILIHAGDRLIEANSEFRRLTGYDSVAALEGAGGLDALITRREGPDAGVYLVRADGTQILVSARLQSVRYDSSSALMLAVTPAAGMLAVVAEPEIIGESEAARKLAGLKVEVEEMRSILETATDGVVVLDTEGRIRSMNRSASALFNFDDAETRGKPFAMLFAHESQKSVQDYLAGLSGHGVASVLNDGREVIGRESSGGFIPLFMTMGRMPGSNSYCAVMRDITQWKRSEEELKAAKRAAETANQHKSDFLARVSHEIRTPLNAIIGFSDMIASEHFGPAGHARYVEYASDIGRSGRHVLDIVNDLLDISKIEAGEMDLEFAAVGINDCVSEAVSLVQPQANAQRVIIRTSLSQSVPDIVADLRSIKQISLNILANAIRYTPSGGQIVVSTAYEPSGSVTLRIRDTGVGMSKGELDQAMKPFGQVSSGTRQRGDGTGLGLPLTKAMTEANRAMFSIHSAPNEGTLVEITFPPQRVLAD